jgi:hypothetical protein
VALVSTGAIDPLTRQCAGTPLAASFQMGALNVTLPIDSPIADAGIDAPTFSAVQSAPVMIAFASAAGAVLGGAVVA